MTYSLAKTQFVLLKRGGGFVLLHTKKFRKNHPSWKICRYKGIWSVPQNT